MLFTEKVETIPDECNPMKTASVRITVNGGLYCEEVPTSLTLLKFLRDNLHLTGTKEGCSNGQCGACTVLMDGKAVNACLVLAVQANGSVVVTIEGFGSPGRLHPLQKAFIEKGAVQCGFCTPGMIISASALLSESKDPSEEEIKKALSGNLCRCTGYLKIIKAVKQAANYSKGELHGHDK